MWPVVYCLFFRHGISAVVLELTNTNVICAIIIFLAVLLKFSLMVKNYIGIIAFRPYRQLSK